MRVFFRTFGTDPLMDLHECLIYAVNCAPNSGNHEEQFMIKQGGKIMENMVKMVSMKKMKKTALFMASAVIETAIFSGCGGWAEQHRQQPQVADAGAAQATMPYNQVQETANGNG